MKILLLAGASKKIQSMTFSTDHRAELLTDALVSFILPCCCLARNKANIVHYLFKVMVCSLEKAKN